MFEVIGFEQRSERPRRLLAHGGCGIVDVEGDYIHCVRGLHGE